MMERVTREDARVVCSDPHAVKRFQDLSRCVQKKVRDLFQSLGSGMSNAGPTPTHQSHVSHVTAMKKAIPDLSKPPRGPEEIPPPTVPSLPLRRAHPLKPVQAGRSASKAPARSSSASSRPMGYGSGRPGNIPAQYKPSASTTAAQKRKAMASPASKKAAPHASPKAKKTKADYSAASAAAASQQQAATSTDPNQLVQQVRHAEAQRATHHRLAVAAHESVQRTHEAKQKALAHHESMQSSGSSEQIEKARQQVQQTADAYNQAQMQHRKEYHLYQEWTSRVQAYQNTLKTAQQTRGVTS